jgi:hypothetical protein
MNRKVVTLIVLAIFAQLVGLSAAWQANARAPKAQYLTMAPLDQYLITNRDAEIAMARSAAPKSISGGAEVLVLGQKGYYTTVKGKNGFICMVERSWSAGINDPDFWNPKLYAPICFNPPAVRSYLPITIMKTDLALAGRSKAQIFGAIKAALDKSELPTLEPGAIGYMMSKRQYLGWYPHVMVFVPLTEATTWGAGLPGSPILASEDPPERLTEFLIPVGHWSDGTVAPAFSTNSIHTD